MNPGARDSAMTRATATACSPRLAWFLLLSLGAHVVLLLGFMRQAPALVGSELPPLLAMQLVGGAQTAAAPRALSMAPKPVTTPAHTGQPEAGLPASHPQVALNETDGNGRDEHDDTSSARAQVMNDFARHFHYPPLARQRGWEGRVVLDFRIDGDGRLQAQRVARTSGFAVLDQAALNSLKRVERVNVAGGAPLDMQIPVLYRLTGEP